MASLRVTAFPQLQRKTARALCTFVVDWCRFKSLLQLKLFVLPSDEQSVHTYGVAGLSAARLDVVARFPVRRALGPRGFPWATWAVDVIRFVPEPTSVETLCSGEHPDAAIAF